MTISFGKISIYLSKKEDKENENNKPESFWEKLTNNVLNGTYGIIIFNGFYSLFVSFICLSKDVKNNNYFYIPIFINKFYYFTFAHQCTVYTDIEEGIDFFSFATLLSIYLKAWDILIYFLQKLPLEILLYFQIVVSFFIILVFLCMILIFMCCLGKFFLTFLSFISLFMCCSCCFFKCYDKNKFDECFNNITICEHEECIVNSWCINNCCCCCCCREILKTLNYNKEKNKIILNN